MHRRVKKVKNLRIRLAAARSRLVDLSPLQGSTTFQILGAYRAEESIPQVVIKGEMVFVVQESVEGGFELDLEYCAVQREFREGGVLGGVGGVRL